MGLPFESNSPLYVKGLVDAEGGIAISVCKRAQAYEWGAWTGNMQAMACFLEIIHTHVAAFTVMGSCRFSTSAAPCQQRKIHFLPIAHQLRV